MGGIQCSKEIGRYHVLRLLKNPQPQNRQTVLNVPAYNAGCILGSESLGDSDKLL